jgi:hypothetical protein
MVTEVQDIVMPEDSQQIEAAEHSKKSKAKKIVPGAIFYSLLDDQSATAPSLDLSQPVGQNKAVRLVHTSDFYFNIANGVKTATTSDILVPAGQVVIVATRNLTHINTSTVVNAIEVE